MGVTQEERIEQLLFESDDEIALCKNPNCGVHNDDALSMLLELRSQIKSLVHVLTQRDKRIKWLERDASQQLRGSPHYAEAREVLEYWREKCHPGAKQLEGGERLKNVIARLTGERGEKGYTVEDLKRCVDGYAFLPYLLNGRRMPTGSPATRRVDAELIFKDPKHIEDGKAMALEAERRAAPTPSVPKPAKVELSRLGAYAVDLANFGFHVFPVAPKAKTPMTTHGLKDATRDIDRITRWWRRRPEDNIGLRCGIDSELVVLDVDGDEGFASLRELEAKFEKVPATTSVVTPRGGQHYYFRHPGAGEIRNTTGFPLPGLDVRGDGGYVLSPHSIGPNDKRYELDDETPRAPMPRWLLKLLVDRQSSRATLGRDYALIVREGAAKGERNNDLLSLAGHLWSHGHEPEEVMEMVAAVNDSRCKPPLSAKEIRSIVDSVAKMRAREALRGEV